MATRSANDIGGKSSPIRPIFFYTHPLVPFSDLLAATAEHGTGVGVANLVLARDLSERASDRLLEAFRRIDSKILHSWAIRLSHRAGPAMVATLVKANIRRLEYLIVASADGALDEDGVALLRKTASDLPSRPKFYVEVTDREDMAAVEDMDVDGYVFSGNDAGLRTGAVSTLVLFQKLAQRARGRDVVVKGGIGIYAAAAFLAVGAHGVAFESEMFLSPLSGLSVDARDFMKKMQPSQVRQTRQGNAVTSVTISRQGGAVVDSKDYCRDLTAVCSRHLEANEAIPLWAETAPLGREALLAPSVYGLSSHPAKVIDILNEELHRAAYDLSSSYCFAKHAPLARFLGSHYPIVQGPMAWISDKTSFARSVAQAGGLPIFALGSLDEAECRQILDKADGAELAAYGVGLVGFERQDLLERQFELLAEYGPSVVILAGGTPEQCLAIEKRGTKVFTHVPAARLLPLFLERGVENVILEGRESGGHIGQLSSQMLWEMASHEILEHRRLVPDQPIRCLLAGGLASDVAALYAAFATAKLQRTGVAVGLQVGTAYLATDDAVDAGVITPLYHRMVREAQRTTIVGTPLGHAIRLLDSPLSKRVAQWEERYKAGRLSKSELEEKVKRQLLGRLRVAARGRRTVEEDRGSVVVDEKEQRETGAFMAGDVATIGKLPSRVEELHRRLHQGSHTLLEKLVSTLDLERPRQLSAVLERDLFRMDEGASSIRPYPLLLGGPTRQALGKKIVRLLTALQSQNIDQDDTGLLARIAKQASRAYTPSRCCLAIITHSLEDLVQSLSTVRKDLDGLRDIVLRRGLVFLDGFRCKKIAFLFPGQGSHYRDMLKSLVQAFPEVKGYLDRCRRYLQDKYQIEPLSQFYTDGGPALEKPWHIQPVIWAIETALLSLFSRLGIEGSLVAGHSLGELAALKALEIFPSPDVLDMVCKRAIFVGHCTSPGGMTAVRASEEVARRIIERTGMDVSLANVNSPVQVVVGGKPDSLDDFESCLRSHGVAFTRLKKVTQAFHTDNVVPAVERYHRLITDKLGYLLERGRWSPSHAATELNRLVSNVTGRTYAESLDSISTLEGSETLEPEAIIEVCATLLSEHIRQPVRFVDVVECLAEQGANLFVEVGPGKAISGMIRAILPKRRVVVKPCLEAGRELHTFTETVALLALCGKVNRLDKLFPEEQAPLPAPIHSALFHLPEVSRRPSLLGGHRRDRAANISPPRRDDIAVVGLAIRVAGADEEGTFFENLVRKIDASSEIPPWKWDAGRFYDRAPDSRNRTYCKRGAVVAYTPERVDRFRIQPRAVDLIDRMQILALEVLEQLLADVGYDAKSYPHRETAVVVGYAYSENTTGRYSSRIYLEQLKDELRSGLLARGLTETATESFVEDFLREQDERLMDFGPVSALACLSNMISARIARHIDLSEPNFVVDSACASSLSALDVSLLKLRSGQCSYAITGGLDDFSVGRQVGFSKIFALSQKEQCTPFDSKADGLIQGDGIGLLLLTTVGRALDDGLPIRAVIRGMGGSCDGRASSGLTVPSIKRQAMSVEKCLRSAGWDPAHVDYIEAHGTGTPVGDVVEIRSLAGAFSSLPPSSIPVGSVKANVGHTMVASGAVSLIKVILAMERGLVPPTINIDQINPRLKLDQTPFFLPRETMPWFRREPATPRRALVCAYGFGGTNYHVALEEYLQNRSMERDRAVLLCLQGHDEQSLASLAGDTVLDVKRHGWEEISRLAGLRKTDGTPRFRAAMVVRSAKEVEQAVETLVSALKRNIGYGREIAPDVFLSDCSIGPSSLRPVFLFPGHGSEYEAMGSELYETSPVFREIMDMKLAACFEFHHAVRELYDRTGRFIPTEDDDIPEEKRPLFVSTALTAVTVAYLRMVDLLGLCPEATAGYSLGEYTALLAAGVLSLSDYMALEEASLETFETNVVHLDGWMTSVVAPGEVVAAVAKDNGVDIAMAMPSGLHVLTGASEAMKSAEEALEERGEFVQRITPSYPYHWSKVAFLSEELAERLKQCIFMRPPLVPVYSSVGRAIYGDAGVHNIGLLSRVPFSPLDVCGQIEAMADDGYNLFIEIGPGTTFTNMARQLLRRRDVHCVAVDGQAGANVSRWSSFLTAIGRLHCLGCDLKLQELVLVGGLRQAGWSDRNLDVTGGDHMEKSRYDFLIEYLRTNERIAEKAFQANERAFNMLMDDGASYERPIFPHASPTPDTPKVNAASPASSAERSVVALDEKGEKPRDDDEGQKSPPAESGAPASAIDRDTREKILQVITKHTGYDPSVLTDDADLQNDLAIDSIQQMLILGDIKKVTGVDLAKHLTIETRPETLGELMGLVAVNK